MFRHLMVIAWLAFVAVVSSEKSHMDEKQIAVCTANDTKIMTEAGGAAMVTLDMSKCGWKCLGGRRCVLRCLQKQRNRHYSEQCLACFGVMNDCGKKHCLRPCGFGTQEACDACGLEHCRPAFRECTGWPEADYPYPTPSPQLMHYFESPEAEMQLTQDLEDDEADTPVSLNADGACTANDTKIMAEAGGAAMVTLDMSKCGWKCLGGRRCVLRCLQKQRNRHYSEPCLACFGVLNDCGKKHCLRPCGFGTQEACDACGLEHCRPAFRECTGWPEPDYPYPTAAPQIMQYLESPEAELQLMQDLESSEAETPVSPNVDACTANDTKIMAEAGGAAMVTLDMSKCGWKCLGGRRCVLRCLQKQRNRHYSEPCLACFGVLNDCGKKHCLRPCGFGTQEACDACGLEHCRPAFRECTGWPEPDYPYPTPQPQLMEHASGPSSPGFLAPVAV